MRPVWKNPLVAAALGLVVVATGVAIALRPQPPVDLPVLAQLPDFSLKTQSEAPYALADLRGKVSIVNFIFTSCPDTCPLLTRQMAKIQKAAADEGVNVNLVSLSVDPETDTPAVLRDYAAKNKLDLKNWNFITGPLAAIEKVTVEGFKVGYDKSAENIFDITHTEHFALIDQQGRIRTYARVPNHEAIESLLELAKGLVKSPSAM